MPKSQKEKKPLYNFRSGNYGKGYHGEVFKKHRGDKKAADRAYHETAQRVMKHVGEKDPRAVQHYLDSVHGRFLRGRENKSAYIKLDYARFKKAYKPENFYTEETMSKENLNVADEKVTEAEDINPEVAVLFESIVENKPHTAKEILDKILSDKLSDHLDAYKIALAKRMFNGEEIEESEEDSDPTESEIEDFLNNLSDDELEELLNSEDEIEESEQLDEISKKKLGSYIKKASGSLVDIDLKKYLKRKKFIDKAADKLANEATQLDEISKQKLIKYASRAMNDVRNDNQAIGRFDKGKYIAGREPTDPEHAELLRYNRRKAKNREAGVRKVLSRLANEAIDKLEKE